MIKFFYGEDRVRAKQAIEKFLGDTNYEIIEGADLTPADLPSIFLGNSLFADTRSILIRDLTANKPVYEKNEMAKRLSKCCLKFSPRKTRLCFVVF